MRGFGNFYYIISKGLNALKIKSYKYINIKIKNGMRNSKQQTEKAFAAMMSKMTKTQFAEKWNDVEGVLDLEEIKKATEACKKLSPLLYDCIKAYKNGRIIYKFTYDGMYLFITAVVRYKNEQYKLEGKHNYGRVNLTKVSYNYDLLDRFYEKLLEHAESVCGEVSVGLTVIAVGDSSVELELHENDNGRTVAATIQDGSATETQVRNIIEELAEFFGCALKGVEVRKEADYEK